jgi:hypothetical protein
MPKYQINLTLSFALEASTAEQALNLIHQVIPQSVNPGGVNHREIPVHVDFISVNVSENKESNV